MRSIIPVTSSVKSDISLSLVCFLKRMSASFMLEFEFSVMLPLLKNLSVLLRKISVRSLNLFSTPDFLFSTFFFTTLVLLIAFTHLKFLFLLVPSGHFFTKVHLSGFKSNFSKQWLVLVIILYF